MEQRSRWKEKGRHLLYLIAALAMLFYALARLEQGGTGEGFRVFWYAWLGFAAVIIAANVNMLLFVNEEKRRELARIKKAKALQWERSLERTFAKREKDKRSARARQ
ncbi:hypothetical protein [Paenibacillus soyae]|uniref:Uncharacterized protein n=1 Tax=Paenibacillus soyae TaxID=2969249 RepID=A0A9X2S9B3_9BACL|nr:hypothetical protein [Paenibacillus soyae]MCR2802552.1 hypothetical protein [Paenibacillus soyae]